MRKAPDAFRTISEAADLLDTPAHVLRFWESKFPQVKPVKRAGGRRYYRRIDIDLLAGIKALLHDQGMTIRGVQKLLADKGPRHVAEIAPFPDDVYEGDDLGDGALEGVIEGTADPAEVEMAAALPLTVEEQTPAAPLAEGAANAFADIGTVPVVPPAPVKTPRAASPAPDKPSRPPVQAAQLAHLLRTHPPTQINRARLAALTARMEGLVARLSEQMARDRAR